VLVRRASGGQLGDTGQRAHVTDEQDGQRGRLRPGPAILRVADLGLLKSGFIIPSVAIPRSARGASFMKKKVPGLLVPDTVVARLNGVPAARQAEEGIQMAVETVHAIREIPGVAGVHLIGIKWEEGVARVAEEAGLLPRPKLGPLVSAGATL